METLSNHSIQPFYFFVALRKCRVEAEVVNTGSHVPILRSLFPPRDDVQATTQRSFAKPHSSLGLPHLTHGVVLGEL
jgi:hypothetical protein